MRSFFILVGLLCSACEVGQVLAAPTFAASSCGPFASLDAQTLPGWCANAVADARHGLKMPRTVLWLGRQADVDELLVVDMGAWEPKQGRLLQLSVNTRTGHTLLKELLRNLDRPHGLRLGPDGRIYLGEASRITRFAKPAASEPLVLEPVVTGLPAQGRHPLKEFVFGADKALYINAGSMSDRCKEQASIGTSGLPACPEMALPRPQSAVYKASLQWPQGKLIDVKPFALGLRNSMALAAHPSGTVWQAENNMDFAQETYPAEEINKLTAGAHYGWPGCVERRQPVPGFTSESCAKTQLPAALLPAHAAPLHMQFSHTVFTQSPVKSRLGMLISLHGYRASGQRLVRFDTQPEDGTPIGAPQELLYYPQIDAGKPERMPGAPVGWAEDNRGHLWLADDRNRLLIWFHRVQPKP